MRLLDEPYTRAPLYGVLRMTAWLNQQGDEVHAKRVRRWLRLMGPAIYPRPTSAVRRLHIASIRTDSKMW